MLCSKRLVCYLDYLLKYTSQNHVVVILAQWCGSLWLATIGAGCCVQRRPSEQWATAVGGRAGLHPAVPCPQLNRSTDTLRNFIPLILLAFCRLSNQFAQKTDSVCICLHVKLSTMCIKLVLPENAAHLAVHLAT